MVPNVLKYFELALFVRGIDGDLGQDDPDAGEQSAIP